MIWAHMAQIFCINLGQFWEIYGTGSTGWSGCEPEVAHIWNGEYGPNIFEQYWTTIVKDVVLAYLNVILKWPTYDAANVVRLSQTYLGHLWQIYSTAQIAKLMWPISDPYPTLSSGPHAMWNDGTWAVHSCLPDPGHNHSMRYVSHMNVGQFLDGSSSPHMDVSLGKILNPKLLLISVWMTRLPLMGVWLVVYKCFEWSED